MPTNPIATVTLPAPDFPVGEDGVGVDVEVLEVLVPV